MYAYALDPRAREREQQRLAVARQLLTYSLTYLLTYLLTYTYLLTGEQRLAVARQLRRDTTLMKLRERIPLQV